MALADIRNAKCRAGVLRKGRRVSLVLECEHVYDAMALYEKIIDAMNGPGITLSGINAAAMGESDDG